jgi:geranylgeranyl pyrophosphate synthase
MRSARTKLPQPFETDRRALERYLTRRLNALDAMPKRLADAIRHAALAPGKRLRPLLVLLGYDAVGGDLKKRTHVIPAAAALELVHAFSLVHDDLPALDDDDLRRGRPTVHKKFDEATAILAGDALLALAFEELALAAIASGDSQRGNLAIHELATATNGMISGQVLDLAAEGRWGRAKLTKKAVEKIHLGKTGSLIAAALVIGGCLGGGTARQLAALEAVGLDLGLAFQIADDLLNESGDAKILGKNAGTDRARGKATMPRATGSKAAARALEQLHTRALERAEVFPTVRLRFVTLAQFLAVRRA